MKHKQNRTLFAISGGLLIIVVSPLLRSYSEFFYYMFLVAGVVLVFSNTYLWWKNRKH